MELRFGGSTASRYINCPGSVALCAMLPPQKETFAMIEGSYAHFLAAGSLKHWKRTNTNRKTIHRMNRKEIQKKPLSPNFEGSGFDMHPDEEMFDAIEFYFNSILDDMEKCGAAATDLFVEKEFSLTNMTEGGDVEGTADAGFAFGNTLYIYDFKYGKGKQVHAYENDQGLFYAIGAYLSMDAADRKKITDIQITFIQPRAWLESCIKSVFRTTPEELSKFSKRLRASIKEAKSETPELITGCWCDEDYCQAAAYCPAVHKESEEAMQFKVGGQVVLVNENEVGVVGADKLVSLYECLDKLTALKSKVYSAMETRALQGEEIPGYKLVQGEKNRTYRDKDDALMFLNKMFPKEIFTKKPEIKGIGDIEAQLKKLGATLPVDLVYKPIGEVKLVRGDAKGQAITTIEMPQIAEEIFDEL